MTEERLYRLSCRAARELLGGLDRSDWEGVHDKLEAIRHYLTLVETTPAGGMRGGALYRREQMEALAGVTERLTGALETLRERCSAEVDAIGANRALLSHLVTQSTPGRRFPAAGCT